MKQLIILSSFHPIVCHPVIFSVDFGSDIARLPKSIYTCGAAANIDFSLQNFWCGCKCVVNCDITEVSLFEYHNVSHL